MRTRTRLAIGAVASLALATTVAVAPAIAAGPKFSAPAKAAGGTPVRVRSVDNCPAPIHPDNYRYVNVSWHENQASPNGGGGSATAQSYALADVRPDGSWEVHITATADPEDGPTASYFLLAQCYEVNLTSANEPETNDGPTFGPNAYCIHTSGTGDPEELHRMCYEPRRIQITSPPSAQTTGDEGAGDDAGDGAGGDDASDSDGSNEQQGSTAAGETGGGGTSDTLPETMTVDLTRARRVDLRTGYAVSDDEAAARVRAYLRAQRDLAAVFDEVRGDDQPEIVFAAPPVPAASTGSGNGGVIGGLVAALAVAGFVIFGLARRVRRLST